MRDTIYQIAQEAGQKILQYYGDTSFSVKEDLSPLTEADQTSHAFLCVALKQLKDIPILSEEIDVPFDVRKNWTEFWLIDPLDGTKEFLNSCDEFCINIALMHGNRPVLGAIYAPALKEFYFATKEHGFTCIGREKLERKDRSIKVVSSRFHHSEKTKKFMELNNFHQHVTIGAALKFGRLALGEIDLYPRFEGSKEWDTAAGQIIIKKASGFIKDLTTGIEPLYNKPAVQNNYFIAAGCHIDMNILKLPGSI